LGSAQLTAGMLLCPEIAKAGLIDLMLTYSIGKLYGFAGFGVVQEVFPGRIRPENAVRMHSAQLDALFRIFAKKG
jgi:hypothetical protein